MDPFQPIKGGSANNYDYVNGDPINNLDLAGTWCIGKRCIRSPDQTQVHLARCSSVRGERRRFRGPGALGFGTAGLGPAMVLGVGSGILSAGALVRAHTQRKCRGGKGSAECFADAVNIATLPFNGIKAGIRASRFFSFTTYF
ncbi:MAG: hypothetical protein H0U92_02260 [Actinobacteria bacterium]|nr:hypothetical protein [Actinomycetota bacterium]